MLYKTCVTRWQIWRRYFVIIGGIFIYLPIGVPWYFGNLATYINSYYHSNLPTDHDVVDPQWIFSAFFITFSLAIIVSGYLSNKYGPRLIVLSAMIIHSTATFCSFLAIQHSMVALILTFGAVGGLGAGLAYGPPLPVVIKWMPRRVGLASGALMTGFGGGAVFYNELVTFFINPDNLKPDVKGEHTTYFSQPKILAKIPVLFLLLGALTVALQTVGILLLRLPQEGDEIEAVEMQEVMPIVPDKMAPNKMAPDKMAPEPSTQTSSIREANGEQTTRERSEVKVEEVSNKTPLEVLKTLDFYILWLALAFNHYGYIIKNNYYKEFGQLVIDNDHFLTTTGTVATVGVSLARLAWGVTTDWLGVKLTLLVFTTCTTVVTVFWYFTLFVSPGLYMFWVIAVSAVFTGAFILFPLAALRCFGEQHYATNYGLILSAQIVLNLVSPPIIKLLLVNFGWFWLFFSIAFVNFLGTLALLFLHDPS
ncbi:L-lactate transporter-like [Physella acuta]|uniref:L-lactate transporter-like n=1 Tax=Physella acuta TaxID=109671 RepID=UPI0027DB95C1|nr:L-lactate transporter-like [Physella acuta]XP_059151827.1 L-lactate transporter-like [Physella acuta]XP_059151828.1 L-lactate transporter-like [Physella acuta]XP_059151829.1 L-lactate transporter-like [Physella acuta]